MIDTIKFKVPCKTFGIPAESTMRLTPDGEIKFHAIHNAPVEGTFSSNASIKAVYPNEFGEYSHLVIECSPKFVQGHNIFGTENMQKLIESICSHVGSALYDFDPQIQSQIDPFNLDHSKIEIDRLDINRMFLLNNENDVQNWIRAAQYTSRTRSGRPALKGGTLYWGKNSRRHSIKAYSKSDDIKAHPIQCKKNHLLYNLIDTAKNTLRLEVTLRQTELRTIDLKFSSDFDEQKINDLYVDYIGRLTMTEKLKLTHSEVEQLSSKLKRTYAIWQSGSNPLDFMSRATFYKHRNELLENGIDISNPFSADKTNVIPLLRVIEATPISTPDWVINQGLVIAA